VTVVVLRVAQGFGLVTVVPVVTVVTQRVTEGGCSATEHTEHTDLPTIPTGGGWFGYRWCRRCRGDDIYMRGLQDLNTLSMRLHSSARLSLLKDILYFTGAMRVRYA
jgi:hypothetical protein